MASFPKGRSLWRYITGALTPFIRSPKAGFDELDEVTNVDEDNETTEDADFFRRLDIWDSKSVADKLALLGPLIKDPEIAALVKVDRDATCLSQLLIALDDNYENARQNLLTRQPLPAVDEAITELLPVERLASALIYTVLKNTLYRNFSDIAKNYWGKWELRVMVLLSQTLQIILFRYGNRHKYKPTTSLIFLVWATYMLADWVATVSLGSFLDKEGYDIVTSNPSNQLMAFWPPFLLLHLGGPDTITAYVLEDNELWLRHVLGIVIQSGIASYVCFRFWDNHSCNIALSVIDIPILLAGIIKYGERIWALKSACSKQIKRSLISASENKQDSSSVQQENIHSQSSAVSLHEAHLLFELFRHLFAGLPLTFFREAHNYFMPVSQTPEQAFKKVQVELGLLYDMIHTKASILDSQIGKVLRSISMFCSMSALVAFLVSIDRQPYSKIDIGITFALLVGAVFLDIYGLLIHLSSDWTRHRLTKKLANIFSLTKEEGSSGSIPQYNLISFSLEAKRTKLFAIQSFFNLADKSGEYWLPFPEDLDHELKQLIYDHLNDKRFRYIFSSFNYDYMKNYLLAERGKNALMKFSLDEKLKWSVDVDFDQSLMIWHIATDLNYYSTDEVAREDNLKCKVSKCLSDYMFYLLSVRDYLLPKWISKVRVRDTCKDVEDHFPSEQVYHDFLRKNGEHSKLRENGKLISESSSLEWKGKKSSLSSGIRLADELQSLGRQKWEVTREVWVEMLTYAASQGEWNPHFRQLRRGKELLTQVRFLMTHLFLSTQIHLVECPDLHLLKGRKDYDHWNQLYDLV